MALCLTKHTHTHTHTHIYMHIHSIHIHTIHIFTQYGNWKIKQEAIDAFDFVDDHSFKLK